MDSQAATLAGEGLKEPKRSFFSKWYLMGCFWIVQALALAALTCLFAMQGHSVRPANPVGDLSLAAAGDVMADLGFWRSWFFAVLFLMALQAVMVWPVRRPRARSERGWALWLSIGVAGLAGVLLSAALLFTFGAVCDVTQWDTRWPSGEVQNYAFGIWCVIMFVLGWALMYRFCARGLRRGATHESLLGRIASVLFLGTLVEVLAIIPIDVMVRRKTSCYSLGGTLWAYALAIGAGLITLGPGIFLLTLGRRRKRWYAGHCDACGYDMSALLASGRQIDRCPECGTGWRPAKDDGHE